MSNRRESSGRRAGPGLAGGLCGFGAGLLLLGLTAGSALADDAALEEAFSRERAALMPEEGAGAKLTWVLTAELWLTKVDGDFSLQGVPMSIDAGLGSGDEDDSSFGSHLRAELFIGRVLLFLDTSGAWAHVDRTTVGVVPGELDFGIWWFEFGGGYRLVDLPGKGEGARLAGFSLDALVGGRVTRVRAEFDPDFGGNIDNDQTWIEPYVGGQLNWRPTPHLSVRAAGDVGGFGADGSNLSWQAEATIGYTFLFSRNALTVYGGYRALGQDFDNEPGQELSGWNGTVQGPVAGVTFEF